MTIKADQENELAMFYIRYVEMPTGEVLTALVCNRIKGPRIFLSKWNPAIHALMVAWQYDGKFYHYSFYAEDPDVDVSELAEYYGGGGHRGAASCVTREMLFTDG